MLTGKDKVLEFIRFNKCIFWRVQTSEKGSIIFRSEDEKLTLEESINLLDACLNNLTAGQYFISAWYMGLNQNSWFKTRFAIGDGNAQIAGFLNQTQSSGIGKLELQEEIAKALETDRMRRENEELKAKNKELESEINSVQHRISKRIEPLIGTLMTAFIAPQAPTGTIGKLPEDTDIDKNQERLEAAFEKWSKHEKQVVLMVEKIAEMAEKNKVTYNMARKMLING